MMTQLVHSCRFNKAPGCCNEEQEPASYPASNPTVVLACDPVVRSVLARNQKRRVKPGKEQEEAAPAKGKGKK